MMHIYQKIYQNCFYNNIWYTFAKHLFIELILKVKHQT